MSNEIPVTNRTDLPLETFGWGTLTWLCNGKLSPGAAQTLGICRINPGCENPLHYHPNCEEVLYVLAGSGLHTFDGESVRLDAGMTIRVPIGVRHNFRNHGKTDLECLIAFSSGDRQTVWVE